MKKVLFLSIVATLIAICSCSNASAQIAHHRHYTRVHPRNWHNTYVYAGHDRGKHKGWANPHNPHSGGYRRRH